MPESLITQRHLRTLFILSNVFCRKHLLTWLVLPSLVTYAALPAVDFNINGHSFSLGVDAVGVGQGLTGTGNEDEGVLGDGVDGTLLASISLEKQFDGNTIFVAFETGYGDGVDARAETFNGFNDNATGDAPFEVIELWYDHAFSDRTTWRIGHIDITYAVDGNEVANDGGAQFMSPALVNFTPVAGRYDNGPGTAVVHDVNEQWQISAGVVDPGTDGEPYTDLFREYFAFVQVTLASESGNYRLYAYVTDQEEEADAVSGIGASIDYALSTTFSGFMRLGVVFSDETNLHYGLSGGVTHSGLSLLNSDEYVGLAASLLMTGDDYQDETNFTTSETLVEAYYATPMNEFMLLSLHGQLIANAIGDGKADTLAALAMRGTISF